jgi:SAM-dependent methyltransferase
MKNADAWAPTKYESASGRWRVSRDRSELLPASRVSASLSLAACREALGEHARGHFADLGCGKVPFYGLYRDSVDEVTCIDWPGSAHGSEHVDVFADLNLATSIPAASFDTIFSSSVLEHIWKHDMFWDEMARMLRPGGKIILSVPFIYWLHEEPHDYFRWTRHALVKACEERDLAVVSLKPYGGGPDVLLDLLLRSVAGFSMSLAALIAPAAEWLANRPMGRRLASGSAEKLPLGYVLVAQKSLS